MEQMEMDAMTEQTALVVLDATTLPTILANDKDDILGKLARKVAAHRPDVSTKKGRDEIRSLAAEVASGKMDLIRLGKNLTEDWRTQTKAVNAECAIIEERMNELKENVRAPLTEFENREKSRVAAHEASIQDILMLGIVPPEMSSADLAAAIDTLASLHAGRDWQEFTDRAMEVRRTVTETLVREHQLALKREAEAAELARLRAAEVERARLAEIEERKARDAAIALAAAEQARQIAERKAAEEAAEAERLAAAERQRIEDKAKAAAHAAEMERQRLIDEAEAERQAAAKREQDAKDEAARAEAARLKAIENARIAVEKAELDRKEASAQAERDRIAAVEAERKRAAAQQEADRAAEAKRLADMKREEEARAANVAHQRKINREALAGLIEAGATEELGQAIIRAIATGNVAHIIIRY